MTSYSFEIYEDQETKTMAFGSGKAPTLKLTRSVLSEITQNKKNHPKLLAKSDGCNAFFQKDNPQTSASKGSNQQNKENSFTSHPIQEYILQNLHPVAAGAPLLVDPSKEDGQSSSGVSFTDDSNDSSVLQDTTLPPIGKPSNNNNDHSVPEYSAEIHSYLKVREAQAMPKRNYMEKQRHIAFSMRAILVDWMVEVAQEYKLSTRTVYLAVSYVDRFLSLMMVERSKLQLVGTAAMFVAAKYEEIYPPAVEEFAFITDDTYSKKQVLCMEHLILKVLRFDVSVPTSHDFLDDYCRMFEMDGMGLHLVLYLSELSLLDGETFLKFPPSVVAASSVVLARHTLEMEACSDPRAAKMGYNSDDLKECVDGLYTAFVAAPTLDQQAIQTKYKDLRLSNVAGLSPVNILKLKIDYIS